MHHRHGNASMLTARQLKCYMARRHAGYISTLMCLDGASDRVPTTRYLMMYAYVASDRLPNAQKVCTSIVMLLRCMLARRNNTQQHDTRNTTRDQHQDQEEEEEESYNETSDRNMQEPEPTQQNKTR